MLDTKWKKFKYSGWTKSFVSLLILLGGTVFIWCLLWFAIYGDTTIEEIADSYEYRTNFLSRVHNLAELNTTLVSIENINAQTDDEGERLNLYDRYNRAQNKLSEAPNFIYIVKDLKTNRVVKTNTRLKAMDFSEQENYLIITKDLMVLHYGSVDATYELSDYLGYINSKDTRYLGEDILQMLSSKEYGLYVAVRNNLEQGDIFYDLSVRNDGTSEFVSNWQMLLTASSIVFAIGLILMAFLCGRLAEDDKIHTNAFDRIYSEIQVVMFSCVIPILYYGADSTRYNSHLRNMVSEVSIQLLMISFLSTMIGLVFYCSLIRQIKSRILFRASLFGVVIRFFVNSIKKCIWILESIKRFEPIWLLFFICYGFLNVIIGTLYFPIGFIGFCIVQVIFGWIFLSQLTPLKKIMEATEKVSEGELDVVLDTEKYPRLFRDFYDNIYNVQSGMRKAIEDALKGERMKTELITNVSHDLKTPLTSIISYVDLLSKEELESEEAKHYVDVLVTKSDMLKRLIDDLIEASKVSSGNVQMDRHTIGFNELVRQGIGEFQDRFDSRSLDVRVSESDNIKILADGKSMWRVIENIFDNVTKYALENSRVYLQLYKEDDLGVLIVKNISEKPLEVDPEELVERFVRGSESRTTEGSGLGLSIAEGLTKAQNGKFRIDIDGDLFKITVEMPLSLGEENTDEDLD